MYSLCRVQYYIHIFLAVDANYACACCQSQFVAKYNFDLHLKYSQACRNGNPQVIKCGKCGEVFTTLINLQQHIRRHEQNNHPTSTYSSSQEVSNSSTSQTPIPAGDSEHFQCEFCDKSFTYNEDLQSHLEIRHGHHIYESQYCSKEDLKKNILEVPTGERPHQCQYCSKSFKRKRNLKQHLPIHTGKKPHQCPNCSKSFADPSGLRRHLRTHTGERPHQCQYCSKLFREKSDLKCHLLIHTGDKPHQC